MYFCSECGNLYDITNGISSETTETKKPKNETKVHFVCNTCGNTEAMKPKTLVFSKKSMEISKEYFGNYLTPEAMLNIATLPHTRDYICPNTTCTTHAHPETRDAVMMRIGNSFKMQYVCAICKTVWK